MDQPCTERSTICFALGRWAPPKLSYFPGINCCYTIPLPALGSRHVTDDFYPDWDKVPADIAVLYKIYIIPPKSWILVQTHKETWWKSMRQQIFPLTDSEPTNIKQLIHILHSMVLILYPASRFSQGHYKVEWSALIKLDTQSQPSTRERVHLALNLKTRNGSNSNQSWVVQFCGFLLAVAVPQ